MKTQKLKALSQRLHAPEVKVLAGYCYFSFNEKLTLPFEVQRDGHIIFGPLCLGENAQAAFYVRHALELAFLLQDLKNTPLETVKILVVSARNAARFWLLDHDGQAPCPVTWGKAYAAQHPPSQHILAQSLAQLLPLCNAPETTLPLSGPEWSHFLAWLATVWPSIGPVEALMAEGGDGRLNIDATTGLNHYGCSHRPRPWAVTFASSTASSLSERGFAAGEHMRLAFMKAIIEEKSDNFLTKTADETRKFLADFFGLSACQGVILSPSGTDSALFTLALSGLKNRPVTTILTAPDETGSGIPLAAQGCHFAQETACGVQVEKGKLIDGFKEKSVCLVLPLRNKEGGVLPASSVVQACQVMVAEAIEKGQHVLLHVLDLSKTGLLAPDMQAIEYLAQTYPEQLDIVVDVCQARLMPERVQAYLAKQWAVMVTGSKFYTGPPFCGALLLPQSWRQRLEYTVLLAGLQAYAHQSEWPQAPACRGLAAGYNHGLLLRWAAARAEMEAFAAVPVPAVQQRLHQFLHAVTQAILLNPDLQLVTPFVPQRPALPQDWDRQQTILSLMVRAPEAADIDTPLDFERCRKLYQWLNADLSPYVPAADKPLAALLCHVGQPVALPHPHALKGMAAALRLSAGARLVSGEPSHNGLGPEARMVRESADAKKVLDKISLILAHWPAIAQADPLPSYRPLAGVLESTDPHNAVLFGRMGQGAVTFSSLAIGPS
ncbi:hypothetical protein [Acetobacter orientalis]|uniref:hypothetical protein n=1 Tax=Acetobacter orientalis TaxID=146474 RepID=UPI0039EB2211